MDIRNTGKSSLVKLLAAFCLIGLLGCGVIVTQQAAQNAMDDAKSAISMAKDADADVHSAGNIKRAEKLMSEAEMALSRKRRQRAYRLATQAEKAANEALAEAEMNLKKAAALDETRQPGTIPTSVIVPQGTTQPMMQAQQPMVPSITYVFPGAAQNPIQPQQVPLSSVGPMQGEISLSDLQNRIQAAVQALQGAQSTVLAAQTLVLRIQIDVGLSLENSTIDQMQRNGASREVINLVRTWYDQARKAAAVGNYENALRFLESIQAYTRATVRPFE